jgi:uncharacterized alkaline shock family protein YloU
MESSHEFEFGDFKIASGVLELIAGIAVMEVEGVSSLTGSRIESITDFLGKKSLTKGIKVDVKDKELAVDIHLTVDYGLALQDIGRKAQENVKNILEAMTGLSVKCVNIFIDNINFPLSSKEESQG